MPGTLDRPFRSLVTPRAGVWIEIPPSSALRSTGSVTPRAGVWIEIVLVEIDAVGEMVTPRAGVWIEIIAGTRTAIRPIMSHPVRVCGLK